jgi:hypothetical protein
MFPTTATNPENKVQGRKEVHQDRDKDTAEQGP